MVVRVEVGEQVPGALQAATALSPVGLELPAPGTGTHHDEGEGGADHKHPQPVHNRADHKGRRSAGQLENFNPGGNCGTT